MLHNQMYLPAAIIFIALFTFYNPLFSQESSETNTDSDMGIFQSVYITANTGDLEPGNLDVLQNISKSNGANQEDVLLLLGNTFPRKKIRLGKPLWTNNLKP